MFFPPTYRTPTDAERQTTDLTILRGTRTPTADPIFNTLLLSMPRDRHAWLHSITFAIDLTGGTAETRLVRVRLALVEVNERAQLWDREVVTAAGLFCESTGGTAVVAAGVAAVYSFSPVLTDTLVPGGTELRLWSTTAGAVPTAHGARWSLTATLFPSSNWNTA